MFFLGFVGIVFETLINYWLKLVSFNTLGLLLILFSIN